MNKNQYGYYLTDDEFIEKWKQFPSPTALGKDKINTISYSFVSTYGYNRTPTNKLSW